MRRYWENKYLFSIFAARNETTHILIVCDWLFNRHMGSLKYHFTQNRWNMSVEFHCAQFAVGVDCVLAFVEKYLWTLSKFNSITSWFQIILHCLHISIYYRPDTAMMHCANFVQFLRSSIWVPVGDETFIVCFSYLNFDYCQK